VIAPKTLVDKGHALEDVVFACANVDQYFPY